MTGLERFIEALEDYGEYFISTGSKQRDMRMIRGAIASQGYWAGVSLRFYFDEKYNLIRTENRIFGKTY